MGGYLLGFDCGTYEAKGTICTVEGKIAATASSKYVLRVPEPGFAEHDPLEDWWKSFRGILASLFSKSGIAPGDIEAIGISAVMAAITAVDENCKPLRNAILYGIDRRSEKQAGELNEAIGEERLEKISGAVCTIESYGPKIKWIRDNEPEIFSKAKHFTIASGFLTAKLTGNYCVDIYSARSAQPMFDRDKVDWNEEMCGYVCPRETLPRITRTVDIAGTVTKAAARETGLAEGTPVITGTTDAGAEAVSVGVVEPGDMMLMYGSTIFMNRLTEAPRPDTKLWAGPFVLDGVFSLTAGMATTGSLTRWFRDNLAKDLTAKEAAEGLNAYDALFKEAEGIPPGSEGLIVLPYFMGERMPLMDPKAKGAFFGLTLRHTRGHMVKAVLEGIGFGVDQLMDCLRNADIPVNRVTSVGGGAKTPLWIQTVSDICGIEQMVPQETVGASYGDALLAGIGIGILDPGRIKKLIKPDYSTRPEPERSGAYKPLKEHFRQLYARNRDIMHALW